jgi:isopenicillin-N epimerase
MKPSLDQLRRQIPKARGHVELNAGTLSPTPRPVSRRVEAIRLLQAFAPSRMFFFDAGPLLDRARRSLASFLNVERNDLFLQPNVTIALNQAVRSVRLRKGDEILTTDHEYGAMRLLLDHIARRDGANVRTITLPYPSPLESDYVDAFRSAVSDRTRLVFFSHVTSPTGLVLPAKQIVRACKRPDRLVIVDGAHAVGAMQVNLDDLGADAYGANVHKWMMGACGVGFLHLSPRLKAMANPVVISWGDDYDPAHADEIAPDFGPQAGSTRLQYRLEYQGVRDLAPAMALPETIAFLRQVGVSRRRERELELADALINAMRSIGMPPHSPPTESLRSPMTVFACSDRLAAALRRDLWRRHRVICPVTSTPAGPMLRVSTAWFNTRREITRLVDAVDRIRRSIRSTKS